MESRLWRTSAYIRRVAAAYKYVRDLFLFCVRDVASKTTPTHSLTLPHSGMGRQAEKFKLEGNDHFKAGRLQR